MERREQQKQRDASEDQAPETLPERGHETQSLTSRFGRQPLRLSALQTLRRSRSSPGARTALEGAQSHECDQRDDEPKRDPWRPTEQRAKQGVPGRAKQPGAWSAGLARWREDLSGGAALGYAGLFIAREIKQRVRLRVFGDVFCVSGKRWRATALTAVTVVVLIAPHSRAVAPCKEGWCPWRWWRRRGCDLTLNVLSMLSALGMPDTA